ncbi:MAG: DUF2892 domain-containing protein [Myxococcaceae bacterium]
MKLFPANESTADRVIRVVIGLAVTSLFFVGPHSAWALLGLIPLMTGVLGSCPLYTLFGISTCSVRPQKPKTVS